MNQTSKKARSFQNPEKKNKQNNEPDNQNSHFHLQRIGKKQLPPNNFSKGFNVAFNHRIFCSTFTTWLVHDDEPVLVIASGKQRGHLSRWPVAEVGAGVKRRVVSGPVDPASDRGEPGGGTGKVLDGVG